MGNADVVQSLLGYGVNMDALAETRRPVGAGAGPDSIPKQTPMDLCLAIVPQPNELEILELLARKGGKVPQTTMRRWAKEKVQVEGYPALSAQLVRWIQEEKGGSA